MLFTCVFVTLGDRLKIWLFNIAKFIKCKILTSGLTLGLCLLLRKLFSRIWLPKRIDYHHKMGLKLVHS